MARLRYDADAERQRAHDYRENNKDAINKKNKEKSEQRKQEKYNKFLEDELLNYDSDETPFSQTDTTKLKHKDLSVETLRYTAKLHYIKPESLSKGKLILKMIQPCSCKHYNNGSSHQILSELSLPKPDLQQGSRFRCRCELCKEVIDANSQSQTEISSIN